MRGFALSVFDSVELDDPAGNIDASTASRFYAAGIFLDMYSQVCDNMLPTDPAEKCRYAKFRALRIREALKQRVNPSPFDGVTPPGVPAASSKPSTPASATPACHLRSFRTVID